MSEESSSRDSISSQRGAADIEKPVLPVPFVKDPEKGTEVPATPSDPNDWNGPDDPENPLNWPKWKRYYHVVAPALLSFSA